MTNNPIRAVNNGWRSTMPNSRLYPKIKIKKILAIRLEMEREININKKTKDFFLRSRYRLNSFRKKAIRTLEKPKTPMIPPQSESVIQPIKVAETTVFTVPDLTEIYTSMRYKKSGFIFVICAYWLFNKCKKIKNRNRVILNLFFT